MFEILKVTVIFEGGTVLKYQGGRTNRTYRVPRS